MNANYRIGYLDEDISQVLLYERKLRSHWFEVIGYEFERGMPLDALMNKVYESEIDLLMIDFKLNESNTVPFNWDKVERHIYQHRPLFPHIIFTNKVDQAEPDVDDVKIIIDKEDVMDGDEMKLERFVVLLKKSIEQYRAYIQSKKDIINELLNKSETQELTAIDKDRLFSAQRDLRSLDNTTPNEIPEQLLQIHNIEEVESLRNEAAEYLKSLQ